MGDLADLRGDREPCLGKPSRFRLRGRPLRPGRESRPEADQGARPLRARVRRRRSRTPASSTRPRTPATRTASSFAGPRRVGAAAAARACCAKLPDDAGTLEAVKALTKWRAVRPGPLGRHRAGHEYRVDWVTVPDRDATTHPGADAVRRGRSPAAASSRACGGATAARTSSPRSPAPRTAAPPSMTARCGSSTRDARHDRAQAALRLYAERPGQRPGWARQHHGLGLRRRDHRRGRRGRATPGRHDRGSARRSSSPATRRRWRTRSSPVPTSRATGRSCSRTSRRPGPVSRSRGRSAGSSRGAVDAAVLRIAYLGRPVTSH